MLTSTVFWKAASSVSSMGPEVGVGGGVVDEDVEFAVAAFDVGEDRVDLFHVADVAGDGFGFAAVVADGLGDDGFAAVDLAAGDDDVGALFGEQLGDFFADAAARAGYQGDASGQIKRSLIFYPSLTHCCR